MSGGAIDKNIYTIPAEFGFAAALAGGILETYGRDPAVLSNLRIFLPSRRACRTLREAFLKITNGAPLLLPRLQPLGDIDSDELSIIFEPAADIPPAMSPMQRDLLLAKLLGAAYDYPLAQKLSLAKALGRLMDQSYTEDLDLRELPGLVDKEKFAAHWQITVDFLKILSEEWPGILKSHGMIDGADRRNRLIKTLAESWAENPPDFPVIAAGSTGSIPAVSRLLEVIARLPDGKLILPGLDHVMDEESWAEMDETHPQAMLKKLLEQMDIARTDVQIWPFCQDKERTDAIDRQQLVAEIMRPSATTSSWTGLADGKIKAIFTQALEGVRLYECANAAAEAQVISLALREILEDDEKTAALITPDRNLARRVAANCARWGIEIDDSGGQSLTRTTRGSFLLLCLETAINGLKPVSLLATLKHTAVLPPPYESRAAWLEDVRLLDLMLRGPAPRDGMKALKSHCEHKAADKRYPLKMPSGRFFEVLEGGFGPLLSLFEKKAAFEEILRAHLRACEHFSPPERLWEGEDGEACALFLQELGEQAKYIGQMEGTDYLQTLRQFMSGISVRPRYGTHPRLRILGQLEARLLQTDRIILAGLNEGTWPEMPAADPWMSRPMRKEFDLPPPERSTGLAAHDFVQGFMGRDVILTRSLRDGSAQAVPSRWLQRLDAVIKAAGLPENILKDKRDHTLWAQEMDKAAKVIPAQRPAPCPPVEARPTALSVTRIETWLKDPYALYAERILDLNKLDPPEQKADYALKGTLLHDILHELMLLHKDEPMAPAALSDKFLELAEDHLVTRGADPSLLYFWRPRLRGIAGWFARMQGKWQNEWSLDQFEIDGSCPVEGPVPFILKARADRIDKAIDGNGAAIIDYKSAGSYTEKQIISGQLPQLALEAHILREGGFKASANIPSALAYMVLSGGEDGGKLIKIDGASLEQAEQNAREGLINLLNHFYGDKLAAYIASPDPARPLRYNGYLQLARTAEWSSPDDPAQEAA